MRIDAAGAIIARLLRLEPAAAATLHLAPLGGGGNNRVYAFTAVGRSLVAKVYFHHASDSRDRLGTEYSFLEYAREAGVRGVPRPVASDPASHLAIYECIPGRRLPPGEVGAYEVEQAIEFFLALNNPEHIARGRTLANASEAGFTVADHFALIDARIRRLEGIPAATPADIDARRFVDALKATWSQVMNSIERKLGDAGGKLHAQVVARCISPSDFGFHNALRDDAGRLGFIDFEYAGWDDPAKLAGDFFCQPAVPVPTEFFDHFIERAMTFSTHGPELSARARLMFPAFQVKWCCIMLNHFLPDAAKRRQFADPAAATESHKRAQLEKASRLLDSISR